MILPEMLCSIVCKHSYDLMILSLPTLCTLSQCKARCYSLVQRSFDPVRACLLLIESWFTSILVQQKTAVFCSYNLYLLQLFLICGFDRLRREEVVGEELDVFKMMVIYLVRSLIKAAIYFFNCSAIERCRKI